MKILSASLTYTLGKSLYVPLTSRSNSYTLPQTRGPNFLLPSSVVSSLLLVRKIESDPTGTDQNSNNFDDSEIRKNEKCLLPPPVSQMVPSYPLRNDGLMHPSADMLLNEIRENWTGTKSVVFAGEGEPTLRLETLKTMCQQITSEYGSDDFTMRIVTNGLVLSHMKDRKSVLDDLKQNGVQELSVALMTSCKKQYDDLMKPTSNQLDDGLSNSHSKLCQMIKDATAVGLTVECTGVDHYFVNKELAENLADELGATSFRWRPYFP